MCKLVVINKQCIGECNGHRLYTGLRFHYVCLGLLFQNNKHTIDKVRENANRLWVPTSLQQLSFLLTSVFRAFQIVCELCKCRIEVN